MANYFNNALRQVAQDKGYTVGYDNATKSVTVENPTTKKKISFQSGQGAEYGIGGTKKADGSEYGYNTVSDISLLDKALAADETASTQTTNYFGNAANSYSSANQDKINQLVESITNHKPYDYSDYDPDDDEAFQTFKKNAIKAGNEAYADTFAGTAIPGVAESSVGRQIAETARKGYTDQIDDAVTTYAEKARQDYEKANTNNYDVLNTLLDVTSADLKNTNDTQTNLANEAHTIALANYDNIQAKINELTAINPNDPLIPFLQAERTGKISAQAAAEAEAASAKTKAEQTAYENALDAWKAAGTASASVASILGVLPEAKTADYNIDSINAATSSKNAETSRINANKSGSGSDDSTLTTTQYFNQAKALINEKVATGELDEDNKPVYRPKYTKKEFETWLANALPMTEQGDKMYDDIINALNIDSIEFYVVPNGGRGSYQKNSDGVYVR